MIEAVNSAIAAASVIKSLPDQGSVASSISNGANQEIGAVTSGNSPKTPFISPVVFVNTDYNKAVLQLRDSETGDVVTQIPTDNRLAAQQRATLADERIVVNAAVSTAVTTAEIKPHAEVQTTSSTQDAPSSDSTESSSGTDASGEVSILA